MSPHVTVSTCTQRSSCVHAELKIDHGCRVLGCGWVMGIMSSPHCPSIRTLSAYIKNVLETRTMLSNSALLYMLMESCSKENDT